MDGILIVDKPLGKTSFDCVRDVRKQYNTKKVGHIGTLDPMATGVLAILIGQATKLSDYLMEHDKEYIATLKLGKSTNTGDSEGEIIEEKEVNKNVLDEIIITEALNSFLGETYQIPPMYSALKVNGKKLYEVARSGQEIERKARKIVITSIELLNIDKENKEIQFKVSCSKGTYIRTLCEDIAKKLNTCGYMKSLRRTRVGNFYIEDEGTFIELEKILVNKPKVNIIDLDKLINGVKININLNDGLCNLYYEDKFVGIGEIKNKILKRKILTI